MYYNAKLHIKTSLWMSVLAVLFTVIFSQVLSFDSLYIFLFLHSVFQFCLSTGFFLQLFNRTKLFYIAYFFLIPVLLVLSLIAYPILILLDVYTILNKPDAYITLFLNKDKKIRKPTIYYFEDVALRNRISLYESKLGYSVTLVLSILISGIAIIVVSVKKFSLWITILFIVGELIVYILLTAYLGRKYRSETEKFLDIILIDKDARTIYELFSILSDKYKNNQFIINSYLLFASEQHEWEVLEKLFDEYEKYSKSLNYKIASLQYHRFHANDKKVKVLLRDIDMELIRRIAVDPKRKDLILLKKEILWIETIDPSTKLEIAKNMLEECSNPFEEVQTTYLIGKSYELMGKNKEALSYYDEVITQGCTMGVKNLAIESVKKLEKNQE